MTRKELIDRVEKYLNPKYNNDVFTYLKIENAIIKATEPVYEGESMTLEEFDKIHPELKHFSEIDMETKDIGEDEQRRQRNILAKRILSDGDEEYKLNCICTLLESQQEIASLREHVDTWKGEYQTARRQAEEFREQLKQQEEITQDERLLIKRIWSRAYMDTEEDHIKLIKAYASNQLKQKEDENRDSLLDFIEWSYHADPEYAGRILKKYEQHLINKKNLSA